MKYIQISKLTQQSKMYFVDGVQAFKDYKADYIIALVVVLQWIHKAME